MYYFSHTTKRRGREKIPYAREIESAKHYLTILAEFTTMVAEKNGIIISAEIALCDEEQVTDRTSVSFPIKI